MIIPARIAAYRPVAATTARKFAATVGVVFLLAGAAADAETGRPQLVIEIADGRLSLDARAVPLADLLQALADEAGVAFELRGDLDELVSQSIDNLPIPLALERLLSPGRHSFLIEFATNEPSGREAAPSVGRRGRLMVIASRAKLGGAPPRASNPVLPADPRRSAPANPESETAGRREAIEILEKALEAEDDPEVREIAADALADLMRPGDGWDDSSDPLSSSY